MAKSYKFKGDNYIDSSNVSFNRSKLSDFLQDLKSKRFNNTNNNLTEFIVNIPHAGNGSIKSLFFFTMAYAGIVSIGNSSQLWLIPLGSSNGVTCTASIVEHSASNVKVKLTFSETQYGGLNTFLPYY